MLNVRCAAILLVLASCPAAAQAGDPQAGRQKAMQCQPCHGLDGVAKIPQAPNLAGQPEFYLTKSMRDYKSGTRKDEMMSIVMPSLSDTDIENLASYYSSIQVEVKPP
ncbi:MAG TPA: cytochrome c [Azospirillum sp.]|nr:cytochrome c [Azospirillum sp.]